MPACAQITRLGKRPSAAGRRRHGAKGFTLLEAIVALTIVGIALVPALSFIGQATRQIATVADSNARTHAQHAALAFVQALNPLLTPTGEDELSASLRLRWVSTPLVDPNSEARLGGRLGTFRIGFYRVDVTVIRDGKDWFAFPARKIGYRPMSQDPTPGLTP